MGVVATVATGIVATVASLFMAWTIGAGSSGSTPYAPAVGANAISVMRAGFLVGILGFSGAVLQGANVSKTVGHGLVAGVTLPPLAATTGLLIAALLVAVGIFTGYPIATAFTVTGAIVGVGLALGGSPAWGNYIQIAAVWISVPFVGGGIAYVTARLLQHKTVGDWVLVALGALTTMIIVNMEFPLLGPPDESGSMSELAGASVTELGFSSIEGAILVTVAAGTVGAALLHYKAEQDLRRAQHGFLLFLGSLVAFSAGGTQVGLAAGPLIPLLNTVSVPLLALLCGTGFGLLVGSWTGAPRMIKALAQDYSSLGSRRSIAALVPSFAIAQFAVLLGVPVSFNEIIVSAIVGSGFTAESQEIGREKILKTVVAWAGSLVLAFTGGFAVSTLAPFGAG
jgi:PiT family inorganic phosphate transporter